jgi:hypothetical protein
MLSFVVHHQETVWRLRSFMRRRANFSRTDGDEMIRKSHRKLLTLSSGVLMLSVTVAAAQTNGPSAEERGTRPPIQQTPVPGTSTTGNATAPAGRDTKAQATSNTAQLGTSGQDATEGSGSTKPAR